MRPAERVLILGATGLLGHSLFCLLALRYGWDVYGTARAATRPLMRGSPQLLSLADVEDLGRIDQLLTEIRPTLVINCVGLVKQLGGSLTAYDAIRINGLLPHRLATICWGRARVLHFSTDCVFSGSRGMYSEEDSADADDLYGRSKILGEVSAPHVLVLRTSMIGPELNSQRGLLEWFRAQEGEVRGFRRAIFSGLPTAEIARVVSEVVIPTPSLSGMYHLAASPISKYDLLKLVKAAYGIPTTIIPDESVVIDRSLDGTRFSELTGYVSPPWETLIREMKSSHDLTQCLTTKFS
jgi:dTDP-4-dehydrorhamnose reductase